MRMQQILLRLAACCLLAGCGPSRPATVPVSGRVTWQGKPVAAARITFYPAQGRPAGGVTDSDGVYHLRTFDPNDGAALGRHCVTIEAKRTIHARPAPKSMEEEMRGSPADAPEPTVEWLVPEKYSQQSTSPLTAEVTGDSKPIDFALGQHDTDRQGRFGSSLRQ
jgi:hypothetical protein